MSNQNYEEEFAKGVEIGTAIGSLQAHEMYLRNLFNVLQSQDASRRWIEAVDKLLANGITWDYLHKYSSFSKERYDSLAAQAYNLCIDDLLNRLCSMISPKQKALELRFVERDHEEEMTIKEYLKCLLRTIWSEGECFNGKRPFGNSDWQDQVYSLLEEHKFYLPTGSRNEDQEKAKNCVLGLIDLL